MDAKDIHNIEQMSAELREHFIPILYSFFHNCVEEGFTEEQALSLTNTYMVGMLFRPKIK